MMRRLALLIAGLWLYGTTMALMVRAGWGLNPWDVLHEGLAQRLPLTFGQVVILTGALVLLTWIPLRQRPGVGTVLNVVLIGIAADATLAVLPPASTIAASAALLTAGVVGNGVATAMYVGAGLGTGPRDGLWTGLARRTRRGLGSVRVGIEVVILVCGFALGGTVGIGTVAYALGIGPLAQAFLPGFERLAGGGPTSAAS